MTRGNVEISGIRKEFGDVVAVDGIDIKIQPGEFFTILGPSGCGKTTTLRMIAGLEQPTSGEVHISNQDVTSKPANKRDTSIVFQRWALFPHMSVGENISFGLEMQGVAKSERKDRVKEVLDLVELQGYEERSATDLSGGQKQRVAMARSIVQEPDVLLLDEPLASLDRSLRERLQIELKNIQAKLGTTFIYVTHDQEEALSMSDRIAVMNEGHVEQVGGVTELYEKPETRFVADFLGETNLFDGKVAKNGSFAKIQSDIDVHLDEGVIPETGVNGSDVTYTVRPESLKISEAKLDVENVWTGTIENVIYKGSNTLYEVKLAESDRRITVLQQRTREAAPYEGDDSVFVGFESTEGQLVY
jgi:spermidine/putrescine transport system ATP-binding protein